MIRQIVLWAVNEDNVKNERDTDNTEGVVGVCEQGFLRREIFDLRERQNALEQHLGVWLHKSPNTYVVDKRQGGVLGGPIGSALTQSENKSAY